MMGIEVMAVLAAMVLASLVIVAWRKRFAVLSIGIIVGSIYLLLTSDMFLVIRVPTVCVAGMGVLLALWGLSSPLMRGKEKRVPSK